MPTFDIICLANSKKYGGHCVAGIRIDGKGWIRPVSLNQHGTLNDTQCQLNNGTQPQLLDLIKIDVTTHYPESYQPENWLISNRRWTLLERPTSPENLELLKQHIVKNQALFGNSSDRVNVATFSQTPAQSSLALIKPINPVWHSTTSVRGNSQIRAIFFHNNKEYDLVVTDPLWISRFANLPSGKCRNNMLGITPQNTVLLTISLGEPFEDGNCYKLVAGVIVL